MKKNFLLVVVSAFAQWAAAQASFDCSKETVMDVKSSWKKETDVMHTPASVAKSKRIDAISKLFQEAYPDPRGLQPLWYRSFGYPLFTNGGPQSYTFNSLFKAWYCNTNLHKMLLGDETGTWGYVFINQFSWFMSNQYDRLDFTIDGRNVYRLPKKEGEWKGYPLYNATSHDKGTFHCVLILRPGTELPWRPITQKQYLTERRKIWAARQQESRDYPRKADSAYSKSLESIRKNTYMKEEDKAKVLENLKKSHEQQVATRNVNIPKQLEYWQKKIDVIDKYIAGSDAATLQQPAVIKNTYEFNGIFETEAQGGIALVTANPAYFKKQFAPDVPQMMILYWMWENNAPAQHFKQQFEANFQIEKLQAMIDK
jgi:hypothetical protein